jgi:hypothetical protein
MIRRYLICLVTALSLSFAIPSTVGASSVQPFSQMAVDCGSDVEAVLWLKPWDACLQHTLNPDGTRGDVKFMGLSDIWLIVMVGLEDALKVAGYVAAGFVIWGGIKYIKSNGEPAQITQAKDIIWNALFGFTLAMISVAIVQLIARSLG